MSHNRPVEQNQPTSQQDTQAAVPHKYMRLSQLGGVLGSLLIITSYFFPWVGVVGIEEGESGLLDQNFVESVSAGDIGIMPVVLIGLALLIGVLSVTKWNRWSQFFTGIVGLVSAGYAFHMIRQYSQSPGLEHVVSVGGYFGPLRAVEPGTGLYILLVGGLLLSVVGFGTVITRMAIDDQNHIEKVKS